MNMSQVISVRWLCQVIDVRWLCQVTIATIYSTWQTTGQHRLQCICIQNTGLSTTAQSFCTTARLQLCLFFFVDDGSCDQVTIATIYSTWQTTSQHRLQCICIQNTGLSTTAQSFCTTARLQYVVFVFLCLPSRLATSASSTTSALTASPSTFSTSLTLQMSPSTTVCPVHSVFATLTLF